MTPTDTIELMLRLRDETTPHHKEAESHPLQRAMATGQLPSHAYAAYHAQLLLVHRELERALVEASRADHRLASVVRPELFMTGHIESDLTALGLDPMVIDTGAGAAQLTAEIRRASREAPSSLLGYWYVLEGSKNGGRFIARAVRRAQEPGGVVAVRSLDPHGEEQPRLWQEFKASVNAASFDPAEQDAIVRAAERMFAGIIAIADGIGWG